MLQNLCTHFKNVQSVSSALLCETACLQNYLILNLIWHKKNYSVCKCCLSVLPICCTMTSASSVTEHFYIVFFFIYFYQLEANYFTTLQWVLSYIEMNQPWSYMYSPSRSPLPPPSLPDPSGSSQCTRPKHLSHASSLGW